ncbi:hypothetical protein BZG36_04508 [Bifiguratus adelaidae]|uniref:Uncharacterized protein n=1 Tax=Bifiguratus adelaidae TaxID=1938954 RepID=A0A261XW00_9FUNG|nr:hypothetical protein BZG36_04508 [Bifiguratus adelaidae]
MLNVPLSPAASQALLSNSGHSSDISQSMHQASFTRNDSPPHSPNGFTRSQPIPIKSASPRGMQSSMQSSPSNLHHTYPFEPPAMSTQHLYQGQDFPLNNVNYTQNLTLGLSNLTLNPNAAPHRSGTPTPLPTTPTQFRADLIEDVFESVSTIRNTYLWDGIGRGGFLAFPHLGLHGSAHTSQIMRILERWLTAKLNETHVGERLPILEEDVDQIASGILNHLRADNKAFFGVQKCYIQIMAGHVYMLPAMFDEDNEESGVFAQIGADDYFSEFPLFVDVTIQMQPQPPRRAGPNFMLSAGSAPPNVAEVLLSLQTVVGESPDRQDTNTSSGMLYNDSQDTDMEAGGPSVVISEPRLIYDTIIVDVVQEDEMGF